MAQTQKPARGDKFNAILAAQTANPNVTAKEIVEIVKKDSGLDVSAASVAAVRAKIAKGDGTVAAPGKKRGRKPGSKNKVAVVVTSEVTVDQVVKFKEVVAANGGIDALEALVAAYRKVS